MDIEKVLIMKSLGELLIITACLSHKRNIQEEEIRISLNLSCIEGISVKLRRILRSHKIRSIFCTEMTLRKLLCKPKDRVATEDKSNIVYEIDCSNCQAVFFDESKPSLKSRSDEHKRFIRNCDCDKNEIAKHCWEHITTLTGIRRKLLIVKAG